MKASDVELIKNNEVIRKRLAKALASYCFRNSKLENFHGRFSNEEMKEITIDIVNHCDYFLSLLFLTAEGDQMIEDLKDCDLRPEWNDPESPHKLSASTIMKMQKPGKRMTE